MELNPLQMQILKELLFSPKLRFSEISKLVTLSSDHLSYHLKILSDLQFLSKDKQSYSLTSLGKEYANRMDTVDKKIERQPKVSVVVIPRLTKNGKTMYLVQRRLKEPYFGYLGFMTGKIRFGETVFEAAERELLEEAGLTAAKFEYQYTLHEMVYDKSGEILEDKFFNVVLATGIKGSIKNAEGGENDWYTEAEFYKLSPKYHNEEDIYQWFKNGYKGFKEEKYYIDKF